MERIETREISGASRLVKSRMLSGNRAQEETVSYRSGVVVGIRLLHLAQAWGNYTWRMLFAGMLARLVAISICPLGAHAQNATWLLNPGSGDFDTAANWSPATVPTGTATFGASNTTIITFSNLNTDVGALQFNPGAPAYSFDIPLGNNLDPNNLDFAGTGIVNNSSNAPTITSNRGMTVFSNASTAANANINTVGGGETGFANASTAANATITNTAAGSTNFADTSTAANATITNSDGSTDFFNTSTAANATITTNSLGSTQFRDASTAGNATITTNFNGFTAFLDTSTAGKAVIITNSGGETFFENTSTGGQARLVANTGGTVDISDLTSGGMTAGSIEGAGTYLLGSKALTVGLNNLSTEVSGTIIDGGAAGGSGGSLIKVGTGTLALSGANTYTGGTTISAGTLQLGDGPTGSILGNVINNATLAFDRSNTVTFGGLISGSGNLTQIGPGTTILTGDNAYTGGTTISEGTLQIGNGGTTGSITGNVTDNGSLAFDRSDSLTFSGAISGTGALVQSGSGTLKLTGANSYTGGTTISTGAFQVGNGGTTGSVTGNVTDNGILAFDRSDSVTFGGVIRGKGGLVELGGGTLTLTGNNTYSGGTTINAGTLVAAASNALGSGLVSVNDTSLLRISPGVTITNFVQLTDAGSLDNAAVIQVNAVGEGPTAAVTTSGGATITNAAEATISGLGLIGIQSLNGAAIVSNFGIISGIQGIRLNGGGTITNNAAGVITGTDGPAISTGAPVPVTVVNYGSITGATDGMDLGGRGSVTNSEGGTITGGDGAGILSSSGSPTITNSGTISGLNGISLTGGGSLTNRVGGTITGSSGVAILGSGGSTTVSNAGTINGSVSLGSSSNTVQLFSGSRINGALNLGTNSGTTLILDGAGNQTYSQAVTGATTNAGSLTKQGAGNWLIDVTMNAPVSTNVLAGVLTVNGSLNSSVVTVETGGMLKGIGVVNGNLLNGGSVSPGNSPGTLTVNGNFTQGSSGVYNVEIVSPQSYSRLLVTGRANLDGTLQLTLASGFRPSPGQQFVVLSAGQGISGTFRSVTDPGGPPVQAVYQNGAVEVSAGSAPKAAPVFLPSDGTPAGTTALVSDYVFFNSLGSLAGRIAATSDKSIGITFDGGEFDFEGQHGQTYGFPIAGHLKLMDRVALDYEIPLQYVELPGSNFLEAGAILNFPIKMLIASGTQPWSWNVTPTAAIASTGSKEIMGAGALTNVVSLRWHSITTTYGNYISFFEGETLVCNDPAFPKGTSQQIMKNGLKVDIPFGKGWTLETYGIYTQFFQSAQVSSYYTIGAEVGRHIIWKLGEQPVDVGYYSVGLYTEQGNHYNSGHFQFGSAWKF